MIRNRFWVFAVCAILAASAVMAKDRPIQLALFSPIQIYSPENSITGFRINFIYGRNTTVNGLDIGLVNHTTAGESKAYQVGFVSIADADFSGMQDNFVSITNGNLEGMQAGFVNHANYVHGVQFGFVNHVNRMKGIQIGLINIIRHGGRFPVFPIVNWSF